MELKNIFSISDYLILFVNVFGIIFLRSFFLKKKFLLDNINKIQSVSKKKNVVLLGGFIIIFNIFLINPNNHLQVNIFLFVIFLLGLISDLFPKINARIKFMVLIILSIIFLSLNQEYLVDETSIFAYDNFLSNFLIVQILFTSFCLTLYISGNNMIDGVNGNSISHSIVALSALLYLIILENDLELYELKNTILFLVTFLILLIFNLSNKLFLGDNGSYLLGGVVALKIIHDINYYNINPFMASILLFYPCYEVLHSILTKKNRFKASRNHFHIRLNDLIKTKKNYIYFLMIGGFNSFIIFIAILNYESDYKLKIIQLIYFLLLFLIYEKIKKKN